MHAFVREWAKLKCEMDIKSKKCRGKDEEDPTATDLYVKYVHRPTSCVCSK